MKVIDYELEAANYIETYPTSAMKTLGGFMMALSVTLGILSLAITTAPITPVLPFLAGSALCALSLFGTGYSLYHKRLPQSKIHNTFENDIDELTDTLRSKDTLLNK